ncbi:MAG TPA: cob(I)yrinic acid a,c-diamide adenosyltransferase [Dehalococcoidia bacterium]|nr:cob(I)yrinic acid a,c-diamide adenosyltransferase [Dehalococcoidia bacterium]
MKGPPRRSILYTRGGDTGETSLFGGQRVAKTHPRMETLGAIDELNSLLGLAAALLPRRRLARLLHSIQNELFNIGAELANAKPPSGPRGQPLSVSEEKVKLLERLIDEYDARLPPLKTFILPAGDPAAAQLHIARAVCRRAEREVVRLGEQATVNPQVVVYLNRLSDLLFVLARYVNKQQRRPDILWQKG